MIFMPALHFLFEQKSPQNLDAKFFKNVNKQKSNYFVGNDQS